MEAEEALEQIKMDKVSKIFQVAGEEMDHLEEVEGLFLVEVEAEVIVEDKDKHVA